MRQLLLLILVFFVSSWFARKLRDAQSRGPASRDPASGGANGGAYRAGGMGAAGQAGPRLTEPMVRCASCGIHVPKGDAVSADGAYFCCAEHAAQLARVRAGERWNDA